MTAAPLDHDRTTIDWFTFTHDDPRALAWCLRGPTEDRKSGINVFRTAVQDGHGTMLASDGPQPRPHMLIMPGKALEAWRAERSVRELVQHLATAGVICTRLDLARDTSGPWTPYRLRDHIESDRYVSSWMKFTYHLSKGDTGLTVQCGSRASTSMLRCYDKKVELEAAGEPCPFDRLSRWEMEIKGKLARKAFRQLARLRLLLDEETGVETWPLRTVHSAWLGHRLRLTTDPVDRDGKNQAHATTLPEWEAFLAGSADDILAPELDERSPADQAYAPGRWAVKCVSSALALVHDLGGDDLVRALIERGRGRRSAKHGLIFQNRAETLPALQSAIVRERPAAG